MDKDIANYIKRKTENCSPANIVIAGCSCSGKTTLAEEITEVYKTLGVTVMHEDDYFKDLKDIPRTEEGVLADHPQAFCQEEFINDSKSLIYTGAAIVPVYDISVNKRTDYIKRVEKKLVNVFEGLHAITLLRPHIECLTIYLDPGYDTCLERRIERDGRLWKLEKNKVISYWNRCIRPISAEFIAPQAMLADIIIR